MTFPTLPITNIKRKQNKAVVRSSFDGGYEQTRPKHTRSVKEFELTFDVLTTAQMQELENFFISHQGDSFYFDDYLYASTHIVRFTEESLQFTQISPNDHSTTCMLKEV
jgi:phage-related protein